MCSIRKKRVVVVWRDEVEGRMDLLMLVFPFFVVREREGAIRRRAVTEPTRIKEAGGT